jgi:hypothetical protein
MSPTPPKASYEKVASWTETVLFKPIMNEGGGKEIVGCEAHVVPDCARRGAVPGAVEKGFFVVSAARTS